MQVTRHSFLGTATPVKNLIDIFQTLSEFLSLKPNISKCEIAVISVLKGAVEAVCGLNLVDLTVDAINMLGVHFSHNKKAQIRKNFFVTIRDIQKVLRVWNLRNLSLEGRILIFKTLAISKICLSLLADVPNIITSEIQNIQKNFLWQFSRPKINDKTLCNTFDNGGLKKC